LAVGCEGVTGTEVSDAVGNHVFDATLSEAGGATDPDGAAYPDTSDLGLVDGVAIPDPTLPWTYMTTGKTVSCPVPVCDTSAWGSWTEWYSAQKKAGKTCAVDPDAVCLGNTLAAMDDGTTWQAEIEAKIAKTDAYLLVPFSEGQKNAIRCLAYQSPLNGFTLTADTVAGSPYIGLGYVLQSQGQPLVAVLTQLGPILGALFELTPDDAFLVGGKVVSPWPGGGGAFDFTKRTYKGIPLVSDYLTLIVGEVEGCAGLYQLSKVAGRMTRNLNQLDLSPGAYLTADAAVAKALAHCSACKAPTTSPPDLAIDIDNTGKPHLIWRLRLPAKVEHNGSLIDWFHRIEVDAHTGTVLLDIVDCCLD
jgi:hypothetical protein